MPTPSPLATLDDPLLLAFDQLSATHLLKASQVSVVLQVSVRWLEERRAVGEPPPFIEIGGRSLRYPVGALRAWICERLATPQMSTEARASKRADDLTGLDEPILRGGRRKKPHQATFAEFLQAALPLHEWPFVLLGPHRRPVDFIEALVAELDEDALCVWLTLDTFLMKLRCASEQEGADELARNLDKRLPVAGRSKPLRPPI